MLTNIASRIARRYHRGDGIITPYTIPVILSHGAEVSATQVQRLLAVNNIEARDVVLYRHDDDPRNVVRWAGRGVDGVVRGQLVVHASYDRERVVVLSEIIVASRDQLLRTADEAMTTNERLARINVLARRALEDLRADGDPRVVQHRLERIVELAKPVANKDTWHSAVFSTHE